MAIALGLLVAITYGGADFFGGIASRRVRPWSVVAVSRSVGLVFMFGVAAAWTSGGPSQDALVVGIAAGLVNVSGTFLLYQGLAVGAMGVVAPVSAMTTAAIPVLWELLHGERLSLPAAVGIALAFLAIALMSASGQRDSRRPGLLAALTHSGGALAFALAAGVSFGAMFIVLAKAPADQAAWTIVGARFAAVPVSFSAAAITHSLDRRALTSWRPIAGAGVMDALANFLYVVAVSRGLIAVVAVLSSLYPAATAMLARVVLAERLSAWQRAGAALAVTGVVLIALG